MTLSRMPRKSIHTCAYWWPNSGAKPRCSCAVERAPAVGARELRSTPRVRPDGSASRAPACRASSSRCSRASRMAGCPLSGCQPSAIAGGRGCAQRQSTRAVDRIGERADLAFVGVVADRSSDWQNSAPAEQQRRVHRRELDLLEARARSPGRGSGRRSRGSRSRRVRAVSCGARPEEAQRVAACARRACVARDLAALGADRIGGEREAHRADAHERARRPAVGREPGGGVRRAPRRSGTCAPGACRGTRSRGDGRRAADCRVAGAASAVQRGRRAQRQRRRARARSSARTSRARARALVHPSDHVDSMLAAVARDRRSRAAPLAIGTRLAVEPRLDDASRAAAPGCRTT